MQRKNCPLFNEFWLSHEKMLSPLSLHGGQLDTVCVATLCVCGSLAMLKCVGMWCMLGDGHRDSDQFGSDTSAGIPEISTCGLTC